MLFLLYYMGGLDVKVPIGNVAGFDYNSQKGLVEKVAAGLSYILIPLLVSRRWKLCIYLLTKDLSLVFLLLLASLSIIWADTNVILNINQIRGLLLSTVFSVYLAASFSIKKQTKMLAVVFGIVILSSILVVFFVPGYGIHLGSNLEGWTGIFEHKNTLGGHMAWSASIFLALSLSISRNYLGCLILWIGFALSCLLVFLAGSAGGIINLIAVISIVPLSKFLKKTYYKLQVLLIVSLMLLSGGIFILIAANLETIAQLLGKDLTFSGRFPMWLELSKYIAQKPLLGYGFNGFWNSEYGQIFRSKWAWEEVPHSHNGFVELILALGFIGFSFFIISLINSFLRSYKQAYTAKRLEDILPLQFLLTFLISNISESRLLISNNIYWIFYVTMSLSLAFKHMRERKLKVIE